MTTKQFLNLHVMKMFFNACILLHLDYCYTICENCNKDLLKFNDMYKFKKKKRVA